MAQYRKKPVVIEAIQWLPDQPQRLPKWWVDATHDETLHEHPEHPEWLFINTLEGTMRADPGDWIIRGVKGEIYPIKADIFEETYEAVDDLPETSRSSHQS